jgi:Tol biopolymer transport system component
VGIQPDWSHDGRSIAFVGWLTEGSGICICDTSGQNPQLVFPGGETPVFSPDDSKIAFSHAEAGQACQVWTVNVDGSRPVQLTTCGGSDPAWSPDGGQIAYTDTRQSNGRLWVMNADGSCNRQITFAEWWPCREK